MIQKIQNLTGLHDYHKNVTPNTSKNSNQDVNNHFHLPKLDAGNRDKGL